MKLSIVIPHYKEPLNQLRALLSSIDIQLDVDFNYIEVIVINDGPDSVPLTPEFINSFSNIKPIYYRTPENKGVSFARNTGISKSKGEYLMFCDSDDIFHNIAALWLFFQKFEEKPDYVSAWWLGASYNNGIKEYNTQYFDAINVHAKAFRREFIDKYNIRFPEEFRCHEDTFFVGLAYDMASTREFIEYVTYVWNDNPNSMTRENNRDIIYRDFGSFHRCVSKLFSEIEKYKPENLVYRVIQNSVYVYFHYQQLEWLQREDQRKSSEKEFAALMKRFFHYMSSASSKRINEIFEEERDKYFSGPIRESYYDFIHRIMSEY